MSTGRSLSTRRGGRSTEGDREKGRLERLRPSERREDPKSSSDAVHATQKPGQSPVLAAVDLGTNNCRLLIAVPYGSGFRVVDAFSRIVRLGQGLQKSQELSEDAMERTLQALKVCARKMAKRNVTLSRIVATEACRRARNCDAFLERVSVETDLEIEIISTDEEASLALAGCLPLLNPEIPNALVFDIGGGSTELVWHRARNHDTHRNGNGALDSISLPFGVVTLSERYGGDRFDPATYRKMVEESRAALDDFETRFGIGAAIRDGLVQMVGTSGTVTTLAGLHMKLRRYERNRVDGTYLDFSEMEGIAEHLASVGYRERAAMPCIGSERADLVVAGCAILQGICERWPVGRLRVADRGLREGILVDLLQRVLPAE